MARKGFTQKPCPGCGGTTERRQETVCPRCIELMEMGRKYRDEYSKAVDSDDIVETNIPHSWCKPHYYMYRSHVKIHQLDRVGELIAALANFTSVEKGVGLDWNYKRYIENAPTFHKLTAADCHHLYAPMSNYGHAKPFEFYKGAIMPKIIFELLTELHETIVDALKDVEKSCVEYGKNALLMLNDRQLDQEEFNKK